jgi:hypothetical protein
MLTNVQYKILEQFHEHPGKKLTLGNLIILLYHFQYSEEEIAQAFKELIEQDYLYAETINLVVHAVRSTKPIPENGIYEKYQDWFNELKLYWASKIDEFFAVQFRLLKNSSTEKWAERLQELKELLDGQRMIEMVSFVDPSEHYRVCQELREQNKLLKNELAKLKKEHEH